MFRKAILTAAICGAFGSSYAADPLPPVNQVTPTKPAVIVPAPVSSDKAAVKLPPTESGMKAKPMQIAGASTQPVGGLGRLVFAYGQTLPVITCAPLHICVINLMPGETINDMSIGDSARWIVSSSQAGDRPVVILKPTEAGTATNLVITTNRKRVYYFMLESSSLKYLPLVEFYDPQELLIHNDQYEKVQAATQAATLQAATLKMAADAEKNAATITSGFDPTNLDFNYNCVADGGEDFKPSSVFNGDGHTYIQMPANMKYSDAPAVFNTTNGEPELINSRLNRGYYVLDGVPSKFKLVIGTKDNTRSVACERKTKGGFFSSFRK
ncbi:MAG: hypothetical protein RLY95_6 [Pseudomonadota bacterium]|jgi:type IV secretion system protein VirB9